MAKNDTITHARLCEVLHYDPETGIFTWRVSRGRAKAGNPAGRVNQSTGYIEIGLDDALIGAHILAWFYMHGEWPPSLIDHENRIRSDNRFLNLRPCTYSQNRKNAKPNANNTSGHKGIIYDKRRNEWRACLKINGRVHHKNFKLKEDAIEYRRHLDAVAFGDFTSS